MEDRRSTDRWALIDLRSREGATCGAGCETAGAERTRSAKGARQGGSSDRHHLSHGSRRHPHVGASDEVRRPRVPDQAFRRWGSARCDLARHRQLPQGPEQAEERCEARASRNHRRERRVEGGAEPGGERGACGLDGADPGRNGNGVCADDRGGRSRAAPSDAH